MVDPLSIAGLVTGVISLGLQVAGGLSDYLDAVKGRTEELRSAKRQATEMKELLLTIKDLLPQVENTFPKSAIMIKRHVNSCDAELSALHALLSELSQPSSSGTGIRLKLSEQKKLTYPFNRSHISRLEERLTKVNNTLQTALQVTGLEISINSASQIRQVHDLVISISQSQIVRTQSTSLIATRRDPEKTANGPVIPLEEVNRNCNILGFQTKSPIQLDGNTRKSRKTTYQRSSWGSFSFSYGTSTTRSHLPDCPLSQIDGGTQAINFTVEFTGLRKLFQTAFVFSLFNTQGAGGRSLSPNFTYYPTVDERTAPAFRILNLAYDMVGSDDPRDKAAKAITLRCCLNSIFTLYSRKKASPLDIDSNGQSLIHKAVNIAIKAKWPFGNDFITNVLFPIMTNLIACGVPVAIYDRRGRTPSVCALQTIDRDANEDLARLLLPVESDILLVEGCRGFTYYRSPLASLLRDSKLAEASGCGPLSLAARAGDDRLVQDLLKRYPQSLEEINQFRQSPLHLAIKHPPCLRLLLEAGGVPMLEGADYYDATPLQYACLLDCRLSITILLASGSRILAEYLEIVNESVVDEVLAALKQRREELKVLALQNLTTTEAQSLGLHENKVLDGNAFEVQKLLLERGVDVPSRLYVGDDRDSHGPVYSILHYPNLTITMWDKLWALGFRDVDTCSRLWQVRLLAHPYDVEAVWWLIEHGADYWTLFSESSDRTEAIAATPAHFLANHFGRIRLCKKCIYAEADSKTRRWILEKLMQVRVSDTCTCPCSVGGCTPLTAFIGGCLWDEIPFHAQQGLGREWVSFVQTFFTNLNEKDRIAAVRRMTFDALGLKHTCCDFNVLPCFYKPSLHTPEEAEEINSEQTALLTLFTNLLIELDGIAHGDRGGVPLIVHDPEDFWMNRWLPRITETLDSLDGDDLTEEETSAAEAIGVVWGPRPAEVIREESNDL
ncbi:hypothetical protein GGR55DRAFT_701407 [Xylaria sp. FL0064]|nr:hypothetical protein GGR55DRAFT_701407 [Xylaria sp. FL0064]